ncbi:MAG: hypothetical protein OXC96_09925 [Cyanobacteria bacterium MAG CAR1_bin_15]|nr:hypothetical protein [Cyanobacteria bacterium MAG CAR1_bin_15]
MNSPLHSVKAGTVALVWAIAPLATLLLFSPAAHPQQHRVTYPFPLKRECQGGWGTHNVTVNLVPAPSSNVGLSYTVGGSAKAGMDYTALSGTVAVAAGLSSVTIPAGHHEE